MLLEICNTPEILKVMKFVKTIILIIRIAVPILLLLSLGINYMNAVKNNNNDAITKANKQAIVKVTSAILVFFIPTFVSIISKIVDGGVFYSECYENATSNGIDNAYSSRADQYIDNAYNSLSEGDYNIAIEEVNKIDDPSKKQELLDKLSDLDEYIRINNILSKLEKKYDKDTYKSIINDINKISREDLKNKLLERYNNIKHYDKTDVVVEDGQSYHVNGYNGLKFHLFNQCGGSWKNIKIGIGTFCDGGCGLTTCTVLISAYKHSVTPFDSISFGDDYHHDQVIMKQTNNSYKCAKYTDLSKEQTIKYLEEGNVASIKVWGRSKGGKSKFTGSQHFMSLIDYYEGKVFIGNAYNPSYTYGNWGWYDVDDVLTSVQETVICEPLKDN